MGLFFRDPNKFQKSLAAARTGRTVVFTNGCFDLLHVGHVRYLQEARALGDVLVVGLNSDNSVKRLKGPGRPLQNENDRIEILAALQCVDFATLFDEDTPEQLIQRVRPDVLVKGGDWAVEKIVGGAFVQSYGGKVKTLQFVEGHSTTRLIEKMNSSN
jgi:D-beta-D-heptose 7-phosphate kinase/D-beta-D-heptose 1-phosphate adenosyltransferase